MAKVFITGSADGLGLMAAQHLIRQGHAVTLHARNPERAADAMDAAPGAKTVLVGDLSSLAETKALATDANRLGRFDAVIHNAGIGYREARRGNSVDGLPPLLAGGAPGLNTGLGGAQLLATSLAAEARMLGTPASIQTISTNANNQDVVSMGLHAAKLTRAVLPLCWKILAIETIALLQAADLRAPQKVMGRDFQKLHRQIRRFSPKLENDRPLFEDIAAVADWLQSAANQKQFGLHKNYEHD